MSVISCLLNWKVCTLYIKCATCKCWPRVKFMQRSKCLKTECKMKQYLMMIWSRWEGNPTSVFLASFFSFPHPCFPSFSFPHHPPAHSLHRSSPCIRHCFIPTVYLPSLSLPLQHIMPHTSHPSSQFQPSHSYTFSFLFISSLHLSLSPECLQHHTLPPLPLRYRFIPFSNSPPLIKNPLPFTCVPSSLTIHQFILFLFCLVLIFWDHYTIIHSNTVLPALFWCSQNTTIRSSLLMINPSPPIPTLPWPHPLLLPPSIHLPPPLLPSVTIEPVAMSWLV